MKILILSALISYSSLASEIIFQGPCEEKPFLKSEIIGQTVGSATILVLESNNIEYIGSEAGINSILATPTGTEAIEVVSDTKMRAYGWCFEVDGFQPAAMPDQISLNGTEQVRWFFAYSTYDSGVWKDYCTPSYSLKSPFICPE